MTEIDLAAYEPIPAKGIGAERFDEPALFYLTHQAVIDEWYSLRKAVTGALNDWLETTVREAINDVGQRHGLLVGSASGPRGYSHIVAYPETMPVLVSRPAVAIGLGWSREGVNPVSNPPYACVRRSGRAAGKAGAAALLDHGGREFRSRESCKGRDGDVWPIYSNVPARAQWWTDLDSYLEEIVRGVDRFIAGLAGPLAAAVAAAVAAVPGPGDDTEETEDEI